MSIKCLIVQLHHKMNMKKKTNALSYNTNSGKGVEPDVKIECFSAQRDLLLNI